MHVQAQLQNDSTLRTLLSVYLPQHTLVSQAIKAQFNEGDSPLCSPDWAASDWAASYLPLALPALIRS